MIVDEVSPIPCLFFKRGRCQRGADCKFTHDLAKASQRPPIKRRLSRSPEDTYNEPRKFLGKLASRLESLTLYSIITPFDAFEISCI